MIKILKASAGSGKTYSLAREYIRLILQSGKPDAYRHVLAVTFTNKATDEMKRRILQELNVLATNPEASPYEELRPLQRRAQQQLSAILHDYSAFAVSTIDRFFQQTLRAFSRELGQFSHYQVQLDRDALVSESVDRVLDRLSEDDRALLDWLSRSVKEDLRQNGKFSLEGRLNEVAGSLSTLPEGQTFPREKLDRLREACRNLEADFEKQVQAAAQACLDALTQAGVDPADSNRGFLTHLYAYAEGQTPVARPKDSFLQKAGDPAQWFAKSKDQLRRQVEGLLEAPLQVFWLVSARLSNSIALRAFCWVSCMAWAWGRNFAAHGHRFRKRKTSFPWTTATPSCASSSTGPTLPSSTKSWASATKISSWMTSRIRPISSGRISVRCC